MSIEDVILVATAREEIREGILRVDVADIPRHIANAEAEVQQAKLKAGTKEEDFAEPNARDSTTSKAKLDAEAKAKVESEASETAKAEHEAKAKAEAEARDNAEAEGRGKWEAEASAKVEADAKVADAARAEAPEASIAKTELEAKKNAEKERLEIEAESKAEAAKAEKRVKMVTVELRAKQAEDQIAKQRAKDKAARAAATAPPKPTILCNSDMLSKGEKTSSPNTEFCPLPGDGGRDTPQHSSIPNPTPHESASIRSVTVTPSSASVVPSPFTIMSEEHKVINDKQDGNQF